MKFPSLNKVVKIPFIGGPSFLGLSCCPLAEWLISRTYHPSSPSSDPCQQNNKEYAALYWMHTSRSDTNSNWRSIFSILGDKTTIIVDRFIFLTEKKVFDGMCGITSLVGKLCLLSKFSPKCNFLHCLGILSSGWLDEESVSFYS